MTSRTKAAVLSVVLFVAVTALATLATAQAPMPKPVLVLKQLVPLNTGGKQFTRYVYFVANAGAYPNTLFAAAPKLPPCGLNANASRTWVDFFDKGGKRLNGFCALGNNQDLDGIWFALESNVIPPSYVHIEMTDRQTKTKVKSNDADTTP
ncbi:MAG TPA: hypothetical protein VK548_12040 [Candidatus Acidoferrum sp.]|nr:hypothetical protein [Candidatus Acidoferrum sp.]